jgi:proline dehydrogenase
MDRLPAARRFVRRFVAGPALEDALAVAARLNAEGVDVLITHLGENVSTTDEAARAADAYLEVLDEVARRRLRAVPSLKLTHLGLDLGEAVCRANLERVATRGLGTSTLVWVDMESSAYTDRTLALYHRLHPTYSNLACVVQSYLRRTPRDVERLIEIGATMRLCKGAYREPPETAFPDKRDVDETYARLLERLLSAGALARGVYPAFATHDERLLDRARQKAAAGGVAADRYELQMLYGIRHDLHAPLRAAGQRVRVLVPYGADWYGYFMRRLAERPANLAFFFRQVVRG